MPFLSHTISGSALRLMPRALALAIIVAIDSTDLPALAFDDADAAAAAAAKSVTAALPPLGVAPALVTAFVFAAALATAGFDALDAPDDFATSLWEKPTIPRLPPNLLVRLRCPFCPRVMIRSPLGGRACFTSLVFVPVDPRERVAGGVAGAQRKKNPLTFVHLSSQLSRTSPGSTAHEAPASSQLAKDRIGRLSAGEYCCTRS